MKKTQLGLSLTLLVTILFLLVLLALSAIGGFALRNSIARLLVTVARITGGLAALGWLTAAVVIGWQAALQPAGRWQKFLTILPLYSLGLLLVGILLNLAGIGTVGNFAVAWTALSGLATIISLLLAAARLDLSAQTLRRATLSLAAAGGLGVVAWLTMVSAVVIGLLNPVTGNANGAGGGNFGGPDGGPGGPGPGGRGFSNLPLIIGAVVMTIFAALAFFMIWQLWRGRGQTATEPAGTGALAGLQPAVITAAILTVVLLLASQLVPVNRTNPPVVTTVAWNSPTTQQLFTRACADCHSNETKWPWYSYVAPGSWLLASHVSNGRDRMNLSDLGSIQDFMRNSLPNDVQRNVTTGAMPPSDYLLMHPEARLTDAEKQQLITGLQAALASQP